MPEHSASLDAALRHGARLLDRNPVAAIEQATTILEKAPGQPDALALLGRGLRALGDHQRAAKAELAAINAASRSPDIVTARLAITRNDLAAAERGLRAILKRSPDHIVATMMLAEIASTLGIYPEAERLLKLAISHAPDYPDARISLAHVTFSQGRVADALAILDSILATAPAHIGAAASKADMLAQTGSYEDAASIYAALLDGDDGTAEVWLWYGHLLKTMGRQPDAVKAYRRATALDPGFAEAWWSLSELKANQVTDSDVAGMERVSRDTAVPADRVYINFALGKAFEDRKQWRSSFERYAVANQLRLQLDPHDSASVSQEVDRSIAMFDDAFFAARTGTGCPAADPIFIVGMPRAGSTLVEQILASHSKVEGTSELPDIPFIVRSLIARDWQDQSAAYPEVVEHLSAAEARELGDLYLRNAASKRKTDRPFFIDKLPNNWRYVGLIHLILPNAKIIDARRDAMACCFSNFRQHFSRGQTFAYSMQDLGSYYRDYIRMMAHFDQAAPGLVHRIQHEALIENPDREIRRLLDYLELPFEEACLRPHENTRAVRTASSEQVRRPMSRDAFDLWRHYEPWLDELKASLGDAWSAAQG